MKQPTPQIFVKSISVWLTENIYFKDLVQKRKTLHRLLTEKTVRWECTPLGLLFCFLAILQYSYPRLKFTQGQFGIVALSHLNHNWQLVLSGGSLNPVSCFLEQENLPYDRSVLVGSRKAMDWSIIDISRFFSLHNQTEIYQYKLKLHDIVV